MSEDRREEMLALNREKRSKIEAVSLEVKNRIDVGGMEQKRLRYIVQRFVRFCFYPELVKWLAKKKIASTLQ